MTLTNSDFNTCKNEKLVRLMRFFPIKKKYKVKGVQMKGRRQETPKVTVGFKNASNYRSTANEKTE